MTEYERLLNNASAYMMIGDVDKPFDRPECECEQCEEWRRRNSRPTHAECEKKLKEGKSSPDPAE